MNITFVMLWIAEYPVIQIDSGMKLAALEAATRQVWQLDFGKITMNSAPIGARQRVVSKDGHLRAREVILRLGEGCHADI